MDCCYCSFASEKEYKNNQHVSELWKALLLTKNKDNEINSISGWSLLVSHLARRNQKSPEDKKIKSEISVFPYCKKNLSENYENQPVLGIVLDDRLHLLANLNQQSVAVDEHEHEINDHIFVNTHSASCLFRETSSSSDKPKWL